MTRVVTNARNGTDWNTCGQAAIASLLVHFHAGPFAAAMPADDGAAIDAVGARFGPDVPFGLGTTAFRIAAALGAYGIDSEIVHSGAFGRGVGAALERVRKHASRGIPVPVCLDLGTLGGPRWSAHWALALAVADARVTLANAPVTMLPLDRFLAAWRCRHLPPPHHHCAVIAWPGLESTLQRRAL